MNALDDMAKVKPLTLSKDTTMSGRDFSVKYYKRSNSYNPMDKNE